MSTLAFNNYRLAQFNQGSQVGAPQPAPQVQSPNTFNNAQQSAPPTTSTQPASAPGVSTGNVTSEQKAAQQQEQAKQVLSTWFNTVMEVKKSIVYYGRVGVSLSRSPAVVQFVKNELPSLLRFEILEAWLTNALANRYDVIFNNLKGTKLGKIATDPEIVQLAQTLKDQMSRSIGRKLGLNGQEYLELLQKVKAAKAGRPFNVLNSASKIDDLIKQIDILIPKAAGNQLNKLNNLKLQLTTQQSSLINSTDAKNINNTLTKIDEIIKAEQSFINMIDPKAGANILKTVENEAKPVNRALQMAAKLGENPTAGRKAAVASLNVFKSAVMKIPALKGLVSALEFAGKNLPIIDLLLSSADFAQFVYEMNKGKVKLDDPEHPEYLPLFVFSAFKMLLSISMVVAPPLIPILLPFDLVISGAQFLTPGIQQAASKWLNADTDEIQRISEQAVGTPPSNPDAKIVYDWILRNGFKESITKIVLKDLNANWNTFNDKWVKDAIKTFLNEAPGNIIDSAHAKTLFGQISWLTELDDTRYLELYQSLLGTSMNIIKAAKQNPTPIGPRKQKKTVYVPPFINYNKPTTSNTVYNNRRSVTCPSI
jgi:hypothetical protein